MLKQKELVVLATQFYIEHEPDKYTVALYINDTF